MTRDRLTPRSGRAVTTVGGPVRRRYRDVRRVVRGAGSVASTCGRVGPDGFDGIPGRVRRHRGVGGLGAAVGVRRGPDRPGQGDDAVGRRGGAHRRPATTCPVLPGSAGAACGVRARTGCPAGSGDGAPGVEGTFRASRGDRWALHRRDDRRRSHRAGADRCRGLAAGWRWGLATTAALVAIAVLVFVVLLPRDPCALRVVRPAGRPDASGWRWPTGRCGCSMPRRSC